MKSFIQKCVTCVLALGLVCAAASAVADHQSYWDCAVEAPCAQPCGGCDSDCGFFIVSDVFYWQTCNTDKDYCITADNSSTPYASAQTHYIDYDWEFGFRVGAGYRMPWDCWDGSAVWTYFHTDGKESASEPSGGTLYPTQGHPSIADDEADSASAKHDIDYDTLDLVMGRPYFVSKTLLMRPYTGLRFLWLDQRSQYDYMGEDFAASGENISWNSDYTAVGIICGTDIRVHICGPFSLYGGCLCGVVAGDADNHLVQYSSGATQVDLTENEDCLCSTVKEARLGIGWEGEFCGCGCVMFDLGYEFVHWDNVPEIRRFTSSTASGFSQSGAEGQIGFHGFTLSGRYDF